MKSLLLLQIFSFCLVFFTKANASMNHEYNSVCESFAAGEIDAYKTLEALNLNVDDYSIGVNNTAKIFCS